MSTLTADKALLSYLAPLKERTEIRDDKGRLLGFFMPVGEEQGADYAQIRKLFDPEELKVRKQREAGHPGSPLEEVMERIRSREKEQ
jgi:hypothetical protein